MFETIFQHYINRNELPERKLYDLRIFADYLESQNEFTKRLLRIDDHPKITWNYDAKTMDILDKYPKE